MKVLVEAVMDGDSKAIANMLNVGFAIDSQDRGGQTLLHYAAGKGSSATVQLLLSRGANVDSFDNQGRTPLHWAAIRGNIEVAAILIENGASVDRCDSKGNTPLIATARSDLCSDELRAKSVDLLLRNGADSGISNDYGATAWSAARKRGYKDVESLLPQSRQR